MIVGEGFSTMVVEYEWHWKLPDQDDRDDGCSELSAMRLEMVDVHDSSQWGVGIMGGRDCM